MLHSEYWIRPAREYHPRVDSIFTHINTATHTNIHRTCSTKTLKQDTKILLYFTHKCTPKHYYQFHNILIYFIEIFFYNPQNGAFFF